MRASLFPFPFSFWVGALGPITVLLRSELLVRRASSRSLGRLVDRYLRTRLVGLLGIPSQLLAGKVFLVIEVLDWSGCVGEVLVWIWGPEVGRSC